MKFLLTAIDLSPVPTENVLSLNQAARDWIKQKLSDGTIECVYGFVEGLGIAIVNANSHEELAEVLYAYPLNPFTTFDIKPLVDLVWVLDKNIEMIQKQSS